MRELLWVEEIFKRRAGLDWLFQDDEIPGGVPLSDDEERFLYDSPGVVPQALSRSLVENMLHERKALLGHPPGPF